MAQRVKVILEDDLTGGPASETVKFALDGTEYEIDLSEANASEFRKVIEPYIGPAQRVTAKRKTTSRAATGNTKEVREWAVANGYQVNPRGRISAEITEAFNAAH